MKQTSPKKNRFPARPEKAEYNRASMLEGETAHKMSRIPPIFAMRCKLYLKAYYGSTPRMMWEIGKESFWLWRIGVYADLRYWLANKLGFTKMVYVEETETLRGYWLRHGKNCHGSPNCSQHCIDRDVPKWFKILTRWKDEKDY